MAALPSLEFDKNIGNILNLRHETEPFSFVSNGLTKSTKTNFQKNKNHKAGGEMAILRSTIKRVTQIQFHLLV